MKFSYANDDHRGNIQTLDREMSTDPDPLKLNLNVIEKLNLNTFQNVV